jgi:hypothetical protein
VERGPLELTSREEILIKRKRFTQHTGALPDLVNNLTKRGYHEYAGYFNE